MGSVLSSEYEAQEEEGNLATDEMPSRDSSVHSSFETIDKVGRHDNEDGEESDEVGESKQDEVDNTSEDEGGVAPPEVDDDEPVLTASGVGNLAKDFVAALAAMAVISLGGALVQKLIAQVLDEAEVAGENDPGDKEELPILRRAHHDF